MKIIHYIYVAAALFCAAALFSCNGDKDDDPDAKLLKEIRTPDGDYTRFEYDKKNRIAKVTSYSYYQQNLNYVHTLAYSGSGALTRYGDVVITASGPKQLTFVDDNGSYIFDLNDDNTLAKLSYSKLSILKSEKNYRYENGILTKIITRLSFDPLVEVSKEISYDSGHSPFLNCKTPKWWLIWQFEDIAGCMVNNAAREDWDWGEVAGPIVYSYEYDKDNFPIRKISENYTLYYYTYNK